MESNQAPSGGIRLNGKNYQEGESLPEKYKSIRPTSRPRDPAAPAHGAAPANYGRTPLPHMLTFQGMVTNLSRAYRFSDEALRHSESNAHMMLTDPMISGPLFARQYMTSLLKWSIEPEDQKDKQLAQIATDIQKTIERTPYFTEYRRSLLEAIWYGRSAVQNGWGFHVGRDGRKEVVVRKWLPVSGDKLMFRFDDGRGTVDPDQIGIRVSRVTSSRDYIGGDRVYEPTGEGLVYFLQPWERSRIILHRHMIRDGEFEDPVTAGNVNGVGIRNFIYWVWYQKQETMAQLMEIIERTSQGITVYYYPTGNAQAREEVEHIAQEQAHLNAFLMPHDPADPDAYRIERIPPNNEGVMILQNIVDDYFGNMITRFILGQTLSTKADATGMGSGLADLQENSLSQIIRYDVVNLQETLTRDLVSRVRDYNYPKYRNCDFHFRISTESNIPEEELNAIRTAWDMGAEIRTADLFDKIGLSQPDENDETIFNPQIREAIKQSFEQPGVMSSGEMMGQPQGPGAPIEIPPSPGDPSLDANAMVEGFADENEPQLEPELPLGQEDIPEDYSLEQSRDEDLKKLFGPVLYARKKPSSPGQMSLWTEEDEQKHPRDEGGKFASKPGASPGAKGDPNASSPGQGEHELGKAGPDGIVPLFESEVESLNENLRNRRQAISPQEDYQQNGTRSRAFKDWFGDWENDPSNASKVVDPETGEPKETGPIPGEASQVQRDGKPIAAYHGTPYGSFEQFEKRWGAATASNQANSLLYGPGFYFTEDKSVAKSYSENQRPLEFVSTKPEILSEAKKQLEFMRKNDMNDTAITDMEYAIDFLESDSVKEEHLKEKGRDQNTDKVMDIVYNWMPFNLHDKFWKDVSEPETFSVYLNIRNPIDIDKGLPEKVARRVLSKEQMEKANAPIRDAQKSISFNDNQLRKITEQSAEFHNILGKIESGPPSDSDGAVIDYYRKMLQSNFQEVQRIEEDTARNRERVNRGINYADVAGMLEGGKTELNSILSESGYDGITHIGGNIMGRGHEHRVWIAFEPNQIKSVDNEGTFDPNDDRIKYSKPWTQEDEQKHPRDEGGKFATKPGASPSKTELAGSEQETEDQIAAPGPVSVSDYEEPEREPELDEDQDAVAKDLTREGGAAEEYDRLGTRSKAFKAWFGDWENDPEGSSKILDDDGEPDVSEPIRVFHGTTHDFEEFTLDRANRENDLGPGFYFSSDRGDSETNYAGEGPDLTIRVDQKAEELQQLQSEDPESFWDAFSDKINLDDYDEDEIYDLGYDDIRDIALKEMHGGEERTLEVYLNIRNPAVLGSPATGTTGTYYEFESNFGDFPEEKSDEIIEAYIESGGDAEKAEKLRGTKDPDHIWYEIEGDLGDESYDEIREIYESYEDEKYDYEEASGGVYDVYEAIRQAGREYDEVDPEMLVSELQEEYPDGFSARNLYDHMKRSEHSNLATDYEEAASGQLVGEYISSVFEELGHDGIVYDDASSHFPGMDIGRGTKHYIAFRPEQIKSVDNSGAFDPTDKRFRYSKQMMLFDEQKHPRDEGGKFTSKGQGAAPKSKADPPKQEAPKAEAPKAEAPKTEPPKQESEPVKTKKRTARLSEAWRREGYSNAKTVQGQTWVMNDGDGAWSPVVDADAMEVGRPSVYGYRNKWTLEYPQSEDEMFNSWSDAVKTANYIMEEAGEVELDRKKWPTPKQSRNAVRDLGEAAWRLKDGIEGNYLREGELEEQLDNLQSILKKAEELQHKNQTKEDKEKRSKAISEANEAIEMAEKAKGQQDLTLDIALENFTSAVDSELEYDLSADNNAFYSHYFNIWETFEEGSKDEDHELRQIAMELFNDKFRKEYGFDLGERNDNYEEMYDIAPKREDGTLMPLSEQGKKQ